jgi:hypothetical protein
LGSRMVTLLANGPHLRAIIYCHRLAGKEETQ